jgi:hypothetical protein
MFQNNENPHRKLADLRNIDPQSQDHPHQSKYASNAQKFKELRFDINID